MRNTALQRQQTKPGVEIETTSCQSFKTGKTVTRVNNTATNEPIDRYISPQENWYIQESGSTNNLRSVICQNKHTFCLR